MWSEQINLCKRIPPLMRWRYLITYANLSKVFYSSAQMRAIWAMMPHSEVRTATKSLENSNATSKSARLVRKFYVH